MKTYIILLLILSGVVVASTLHYFKVSTQQEKIDTLRKALSGIDTVLPPGSSFKLVTIPADNEVISYTRFILAPGIVSESVQYPVLTIASDSMGQYHYTIIQAP